MPSMTAIETLLNALADAKAGADTDWSQPDDDERLYRPYVVPRIRRVTPPQRTS